jgi:putative transposase
VPLLAILTFRWSSFWGGYISREPEISDGTYYQWKSKYGGMQASDIKRLRELEDENRRLKHLSADLLLENRALKDVIAKKL